MASTMIPRASILGALESWGFIKIFKGDSRVLCNREVFYFEYNVMGRF